MSYCQGRKIDFKKSDFNMLAMVSKIIRTNIPRVKIIGILNNLLKCRVKCEPVIMASSLVKRKRSSTIQMMPKINFLTRPHKVYTQLQYFVNTL